LDGFQAPLFGQPSMGLKEDPVIHRNSTSNLWSIKSSSGFFDGNFGLGLNFVLFLA
jgi:hypothetical protein